MKTQRKWTRWALIVAIVVALAGTAIAFVPDQSDADCWRAVWTAKEAWNVTDAEVAALQQRLMSRQADITTAEETERAEREWDLWAAARQASDVAAMRSEKMPEAARASSQVALEACWLARDNTEAVSADADSSPSGRVYRPGALATRACEAAAAASETSFSLCEFKVIEGFGVSLATQEDYNFFGGCMGDF